MIATQIKPGRVILAENLTRILDEQGRGSRRRLAAKIGWNESRISKLCNGKAGNPDTATLDVLCTNLDVGYEDLFLDEV
jgi:DNA-binding Xre family transcriptional regulator